MASLTQWTWIWANYRRQWRTEEPGVLQSMGSQRHRHNLVTEQGWHTSVGRGSGSLLPQVELHSLSSYTVPIDIVNRGGLATTQHGWKSYPSIQSFLLPPWPWWCQERFQYSLTIASSGSCWWSGKPGMLQSMGSQRVGHDWAIELNW